MLLPEDKYSDYIKLRDADITSGWDIKPIAENHYNALTPNKFLIELSNDINITFDIDKTPQYQSTMLWYHSLSWLRIIYREYNDYSFVNNFIDTYYAFINSQISDDIFKTLTSCDHLVAEQIKNLTYFLAQEKTKITNKEKVIKILLKLVDWSILPGNIVNNNHGMMLASALLHIPLFIKMTTLRKDEIIGLASNRLTEIVKSAFDSYGLCNENTPAYQNFYIRFLKQQIDEIKFFIEYDNRYVVIAEDLSAVLKIAEHTLSLVALPNGELPPFGDGNLDGQVVTEIIDNAEFFSKESGFYSFKHKRVRSRYFSVKCGYSSVTHKHCDDTSIFFWYDGEPVITDAGFLNYDWKDERNVLVKSQRGHSGAFFRKFDGYYPAVLYRNTQDFEKNRIHSNMQMSKVDDKKLITAKIIIDQEYSIKRTIKFSHLNNILISDDFSSKDINAEKCIRFLVPRQHSVSKEKNKIIISNKNFTMNIHFTAGEPVVQKGVVDDGNLVNGWVVHKAFSNLVECWVIEINLKNGENSVNTNLIFEEKNIETGAINSNSLIDPTAKLIGSPTIGANTKIYRECELSACTIGERCTINRGVTVSPQVTIGDDVHIGAFSILMTDNYEITNNPNRRAGKFFCNPITVENGAWIGTNATILGGVTIGKGSIVAAGAVVVKDVPSNTVVAGVPAKHIKYLNN